MLRAVSRCYLEGPGLDLLVFRRDALKGFRSGLHSTAVHAKTVLVSEPSGGGGSCPAPPAPAPPPAQPPPPPPRRGRAIAAAVAVGTSLAGIYFFRKLSEEKDDKKQKAKDSPSGPALPPPYPALASDFPAHVQYLVVGGGTAAFAALRAIRSHRPNAQVLLVSEERALPYMRPPLSKELWQEEDLSEAAKHPDKLSFKQWNGRRRSITYEPEAFYTPVEKLAATAPASPGSSSPGSSSPGSSSPGSTDTEARGGVGVARGWSVKKLDVAAHQAVLEAGAQGRTISYDKCLIATGVVPRRIPALAPAATASLSQPVRTVADVARGSRALARPGVARVAVVGGGLLGTELTAALCQRLSGTNTQVVQIFREGAALSRVLPAHLADDVTRRLRGNHANVLADTEVLSSALVDGRVRLHLSTGESLDVDYVFECAGSTPDTRVAAASRLELDPALGGVLVNAELSARTDVYAAGDVACFYDEMLGRRRVEHHDHAVVSGRLAGENMAAAGPAKHYTHQSMFWSDLGPELGYEAIGIIDSSLQTVSVFAEDAITTVAENKAETAVAENTAETAVADTQTAVAEKPKTEEKKYNRGVVFYLRDNRIVGVLLYNLFNRLHVARQVLSVGEFDDLLEVGKLFMLKVEEPEEES